MEIELTPPKEGEVGYIRKLNSPSLARHAKSRSQLSVQGNPAAPLLVTIDNGNTINIRDSKEGQVVLEAPAKINDMRNMT